MSIKTISPVSFRNLQDHKQITFHPRLNIVIGKNASGKTSLLEAIYLLSTGKSFRSRLTENILSSASVTDSFILFGSLGVAGKNSDASEDGHTVGIKRSKSEKSILKVDNEKISSALTLATISPTLIIQPSSFELLDGSPKIRRKFLDWGVFHVEHSFGSVWKEYIYCLKQRNTLLRSDRIDRLLLRVWDEKLAKTGEALDKDRKRYLEQYTASVSSLIEMFGLPNSLGVRYLKGWDKSKPLLDVFEASRDKDIDRKYTQYGPHRADLKVVLKGKSAEQVLSRGQQKLLVLALHLAHIELVSKLTEKASVTLIDDVTAELDQDNLEKIFNRLTESDTQIICTGIEQGRLSSLLNNEMNYKMFHVEHGVVEEMQKN